MSFDAPTPEESIDGQESIDGEESAPSARKRRWGRIIALVAGVLVLVVGVGAWAVLRLLGGGGPLPVTVMPASTVAELTLDLDPPAGQKVAALSALHKFPGLRKELGKEGLDEFRRGIVDSLVDGRCLADYDTDIKSWAASRIGFAVVRVDQKVLPELAFQFTDKAKARAGLRKVVKCQGNGGVAIGEHYAVVSLTDDDAQKILASAKKKSLADNADFRKWTAKAGGRGVVNAYAAPGAATVLYNLFAPRVRRSIGVAYTPAAQPKGEGAAMSARVRSNGLDISLVSGGNTSSTRSIGPDVMRLPKDTAAAVGLAVDKQLASFVVSSFMSGFESAATPGELARIEELSGLDFRRDLRTLLGHGIVAAIGSKPPVNLDTKDVPPDLRVAVVSTGDAGRISAIVQKALPLFQITPDIVTQAHDAHHVVIGRVDAYDKALLKDGNLGAQSDFKAVVEKPRKASDIVFIRLNAQWRKALAWSNLFDSSPSEVQDNLAPLRAFGMSSWQEGKGKHGIMHTEARLRLH